MILADTSVWVDHLWSSDPTMAARLEAREILSHPFVIGELAMGNLGARAVVLRSLSQLPPAMKARDNEVLALIERERLFGLGIGFIDAHLLAATLLTGDAQLWTRDRRLHEAAVRLGVAARPPIRVRH